MLLLPVGFRFLVPWHSILSRVSFLYLGQCFWAFIYGLGISMTVIHKNKLPTMGLIYPGRIKSTVDVSLEGYPSLDPGLFHLVSNFSRANSPTGAWLITIMYSSCLCLLWFYFLKTFIAWFTLKKINEPFISTILAIV